MATKAAAMPQGASVPITPVYWAEACKHLMKKDRVMKEQLEMSQQQFKTMIYIMVMTIPIFFWLLYRLAQTTSTITLPYYGVHALTDAIIWVIPAWILWYMICSITLSQVIRKALNIGGL